jgi:hypothetical protein
MKNLFKLVSIAFIIILTFASCGSQGENKTKPTDKVEAKNTDSISTTKNDESDEVEKEEPKEEKLEVKFLFKTKSQDDMPSSDISISVNGKITFLESVVGEAILMNDIGGKNSITACGSWWAGAGDYFYIAPSKKGVAVYKGWQDEEQEEPGYHWEFFKEISK